MVVLCNNCHMGFSGDAHIGIIFPYSLLTPSNFVHLKDFGPFSSS